MARKNSPDNGQTEENMETMPMETGLEAAPTMVLETPVEAAAATPETPAEATVQPPEQTSQTSELEPLAVLVDRHRIPAWQEAALLRFMDWTGDRHVSEQEFKTALDALKTRRIGGGRR